MTSHRITKIPLPGGSGQTPTGAMQFQDDWPGLFIRGDDALILMGRIRIIAQHLGAHEAPAIWSTMQSLIELADIIARDVQVR